MASFAKIGLNSRVIEVISVNNEVLKDSSGIEREELGIQFLNELTSWPIWKQTSYNTVGGIHQLGGTPLRKNHAGIGYIYDETKDAFIAPKPYNSWILNEQTCLWESPIPYPITNIQNKVSEYNGSVNDLYSWNEEIKNWELVE